MIRKTKVLGVNNYCLTNHTMNEKKNIFSIKSYSNVTKSLFFETFCLTQDKNFKYESWLIRE